MQHSFWDTGPEFERVAARIEPPETPLELLEQLGPSPDSIVGSGEDFLTELSTDALRELFALSREAVAEG